MVEQRDYNSIVKRIRAIRSKFLILGGNDKDNLLKALNRIGYEADLRQSDDRSLVDLIYQLDEIEGQLFAH